MMNGVGLNLGVNNQNYQMSFKGVPIRKNLKIDKKNAELVDYLGFELPRKVMLERLKKESPEAYKAQMMAEAEHRVMSMSNWEVIKTLFKGFFKKDLVEIQPK